MGLNVTDIPKFGADLKKRREIVKLTATEAAKKSGMTLGNYLNIEAGRNLPSLVAYKQLCRVLRISPGMLLAEKD